MASQRLVWGGGKGSVTIGSGSGAWGGGVVEGEGRVLGRELEAGMLVVVVGAALPLEVGRVLDHTPAHRRLPLPDPSNNTATVPSTTGWEKDALKLGPATH